MLVTFARYSLRLAIGLLLVAPAFAGAAPGVFRLALESALQNSPVLAAQSERVAAATAGIEAAEGRRWPSIGLEGKVGVERIEGTSSVFPFQDLTINPRVVGLRLEQPIYASGRISANIEAARSGLEAQQAVYKVREQGVLLAAVTAYADVYRDQALLALEKNNKARLERQLESALAAKRAGKRTGTDVAQARARLAGAEARRVAAEGALRVSRAAYSRVTGIEPGTLQAPPMPAGLPASLEAASALAVEGFGIDARRASHRAAVAQAHAVDGEDGMEIALAASVSHASEPDMIFDERDQAMIGLTLSVPLFEGGAGEARTRAARHEAAARRMETIDAVRSAREQAARAWQVLETTRAQAGAIDIQVTAAQRALRGVQAEVAAGKRTLLDALDAEQELLEAKADAISTERDRVVAAYTLLAVTAQLTGDTLSLSSKAGPSL